MKIYVSHTGIDNWGWDFESAETVLQDIVEEMNNSGSFPKIYNKVFAAGRVTSATRIFANVEVVTANNENSYKYYEKEDTEEICKADVDVSEYENILISVFDSEALVRLLNETMRSTVEQFNYIDEDGLPQNADYKPMIQDVDFSVETKMQTLFEFVNGEATLEELKYGVMESPHIVYNGDEIDKKNSKLLPSDLIDAIREIWGLEDGTGKLRLFQEDSLFFICERLLKQREIKEKQLLLSMPTGGGKTEAFMIPIIASIYAKKKEEATPRVKSIVIYPTNALANDQAMRFVELIYNVNRQLIANGVSVDDLITIGILSGDTPWKSSNLVRESLIKICPCCGKTEWAREDDYLVCQNPECGTPLNFCRLTRESIMNNPPDILITNPDEINACLHNPERAEIFYSKIDSIVFDEVHVYQGIFGCHVAHLLRRLEEVSGNKPLYIGMSATIKNAKELAALLFNEDLDAIKYINDKNHHYTDVNKPVKQRLHIMLKPALLMKNADSTRYVRTMSVAGVVGMFVAHLLTDSHYRKSIIFTNYRAEADDLTTYVRQREKLDINLMLSSIIQKHKAKQPLTQEEIEISQYMFKWFDGIERAVKKIVPEITVGWNRGGLEKETRIRSIHSFSRNNILGDGNDKFPIDLMIATKSLEVGIDIGDVTTVINASAPFTANEYVQRVGRGGRKKDSLAITVINPENAIDAYFSKHFMEYVEAKDDIYEEAPIIINNDIIIKRHIEARLLDYVVKYITINQGAKLINCRHVVEDLKVNVGGKIYSLGEGKGTDDVQTIAAECYKAIFDAVIDGKTTFDNYYAFLQNETKILNTKLYNISKEEIIQMFFDILQEFNNRVQKTAKNKWEMDERLIGYGGHWSQYTPNLRGNGANVTLHIGNNEEETDTVSRQTAFNQMPPAMNENQVVTVHSGISTFRIDGIYKDADGKTEKIIKRRLDKDDEMKHYFASKMDNFPDPDDEDFIYDFKVTVPNALCVSYFPSRFYCPTCKKGLISGTDWNEVRFEKDGIFCYSCGSRVEQLHQVMFCAQCGGVFDPPAEKVCINPDCQDYRKFYELYKANGFRVKPDFYKHFRFRLTKDMEWECETCLCKINHYANYLMEGHNKKKSNFINRVVKNWTIDDTPEGTAVKIKSYPELFRASSNNRNRDSVFTCKHDRQHKKIDTIGVPRVRTVSFSYIANRNNDPLCEPVSSDVCEVNFNEGFVLQLATQFMRRYTSGSYGNQVNRIKTDNIFNPSMGFNSLGNYYESHLAWIRFGKVLDEFIASKKFECDGDCANCGKFTPDKLDLGENMKPKQALEPYNFDQTTGTPKKPDFRAKFCEKALKGECKEIDCSSCRELKKDVYWRYLVVHTIKHAILWAMPKYAGVNITDLKGEIYPNDGKNNCDIVIVDNNEGGSGSIILVQRHWDEIWKFAREIIELTKNNEANILLAHFCFRNNADLCPFIASDFFKYLDEQ